MPQKVELDGRQGLDLPVRPLGHGDTHVQSHLMVLRAAAITGKVRGTVAIRPPKWLVREARTGEGECERMARKAPWRRRLR